MIISGCCKVAVVKRVPHVAGLSLHPNMGSVEAKTAVFGVTDQGLEP